jgi:hypothetical protein
VIARRRAALAAALLGLLAGPPLGARSAARAAEGDAGAMALAASVLERMGGRDAWERTRFLRWSFFGRRLHQWDRRTGDVRIEAKDRVMLINLRTKEGRVFDGGVEITDPAARREALDEAYACWVNDSYWLLMPYKLLDPGVRLKSLGPSTLADGRPADRLGVTFDPGTGLTPENRYDVWVARDTGLVEQWAYYPAAADTAPAFTLPWAGWKRCGRILLATEHGKGEAWDVAAPDTLPREIFEKP